MKLGMAVKFYELTFYDLLGHKKQIGLIEIYSRRT